MMGLLRKLMTICFGWQYVLLTHNDGYKQVSRATCKGVGWHPRAMPSGQVHKPHTSCLLLPNGAIGDSYYVKEWLPLTNSMQVFYSG